MAKSLDWSAHAGHRLTMGVVESRPVVVCHQCGVALAHPPLPADPIFGCLVVLAAALRDDAAHARLFVRPGGAADTWGDDGYWAAWRAGAAHTRELVASNFAAHLESILAGELAAAGGVSSGEAGRTVLAAVADRLRAMRSAREEADGEGAAGEEKPPEPPPIP